MSMGTRRDVGAHTTGEDVRDIHTGVGTASGTIYRRDDGRASGERETDLKASFSFPAGRCASPKNSHSLALVRDEPHAKRMR